MIKDEQYKGFLNIEPHECFWCGELTYAPFWSCRECYPKKEAAYKEIAKTDKKLNWCSMIEYVKKYIKENF
jgi:hypothetical protein